MEEFDDLQFITDGAVHDPTPARLWVSDDPGKLATRLEALAYQILEGRAPADMRDRRLLRFDMDKFLEDLAVDASGELVDRIVAESAAAGPILAFPEFDRLLNEPYGLRFLSRLCDAFLGRRIAHFIAMTDQAGAGRLASEQPRFAAFCAMHDLDTDRHSSQIAVTIPTSKPDRGWMVAVRCRLRAPAPGLDAIREGGRASLPGAADEIERLGVESLHILASTAGDTLLVSMAEDAVACHETDRAAEIAERVARRLIGRPVDADEAVEATRMICWAPSGQ